MPNDFSILRTVPSLCSQEMKDLAHTFLRRGNAVSANMVNLAVASPREAPKGSSSLVTYAEAGVGHGGLQDLCFIGVGAMKGC